MTVALCAMLTSCDDTESYTDLLNDQTRACNWYLASQKVEVSIPADTVFLTGPDAPFYKLDDEGAVYMQVISGGDRNDMAGSGDLVYFRFKRKSILDLYNNGSAEWQGNSDNFNQSTSTYFFLGNNILESTTQYGEGIQWPLKYLGMGSEVNLVLKSTEGFTTETTTCVPYLINIRYFRPEY